MFLPYDLAILKLERPSVHQPACLGAADGWDNMPGTVATVLGWGLVNNGTFGGTLQTVDVQIIPNVEWQLLHRQQYHDVCWHGAWQGCL
ncbi:hypothetical protein PI125_g18443 [Phytophthora idaei]|nr:hypothetical protein PI125_g18443 [Phytophthora idaei]KAG3137855.1 hypothetical protein PI126_g17177 [Phytophthora idaei]